MINSSTLAGRLPLVLLFLTIAFQSEAINKTWNNAGVGNWSTATNWTPNGAPGVNDTALFTGGGTCNLDMNAQVAHFEFLPTFSGTFNQQTFRLVVNPNIPSPPIGFPIRGMTLNGTGTFNGGNNNILLGVAILPVAPPYPLSHFTLEGSVTFISTSDTLLVHGNFTNTSSVAFDHNDGWVIIRGRGAAPGLNITTANTTFKSLEFNSLDNGDPQFYMSLNANITIEDTLLKSGVRTSLFNGILNVKRDLLITNVMPTAIGTPWGTSRININGTGPQHIVGKQPTHTLNFLENIYIDKPSDTLHLINYITAGKDWYYIRGALDAGTSTVLFFGPGTIGGNHTLHNVRFTQFSSLQNRTILVNDILTVAGNLIFDGNNYPDVYLGTIHAHGNILVEDSNIVSGIGHSHSGGDIRIVVNGTGPQLFHGQTRRNRGYLPNIIIDKSAGTLTMKDTINVEKSWTYIRGTVDATSQNSYVNFVGNRSDNNIADIPQNIDGEGTSATMLFNKVGIDNPVYTVRITRNLTGDLRVQDTLNVRNHVLVMNGNDIFVETAAITGILTTTGYIVSETTPAPGPGISRIHWFINNAPNGNSYIFPFGTVAGNYIPTTLTVGTPGVPSGTGSVSIATYPTDPSAIPNNRPLPPGVANLNSFIGNENAPRELDRFWVYECHNYTTSPVVSFQFLYLESEWNSGSNAITESLMRAHQWNPSTSRWNQPTAGATPVNTAANLAFVSNVSTCSAFTLVDPTLPDLVFLGDDTLICAPGVINFTEVFTNRPISRVWTFPGGTPATDTSATVAVTYNTPGVYDVILSSTYFGGTLTDTLFDYVTVSSGFTVSSTNTTLSCSGGGTASIDVTVNPAVSPNGPYVYRWWRNGVLDTTVTTQDRTNLACGVYIVEVDDGACAIRDTTDIACPTPVNVTISNVTNTLCSSGCTGGAQANATGGDGTYTYLWSNPVAEKTAIADSLCTGVNTVIVTDGNGCKDTAQVTIVGSPALTATITSVTAVKCVGSCDGAITVTPSGGTPPYIYDWSCDASASGPTATALCTGTCTVTITDDNGCTIVLDTLVPPATPISLIIRGHDISCFGANDGTAKVIPSGGTGNFTTYDWTPDGNPISTTDSVRGLPPGTVSVVVTDGNNCTATISTTIDEPTLLTATATGHPVSCNAGTNGSVTVLVAGGTTPYSYGWNPANANNDTITGLIAGTYTVTVTDDSGCVATSTATVTQPAPIVITLSKRDVSCLAGNDGCAWVSNVTGGTPAFNYIWSNGAIGDSICGLTAGTYTVTLTDTNGCTATANITIGQPATGITLVMHKTDITCFGLNDGTARVEVNGGTPTYDFAWNNSPDLDSIVTGLSAGFNIVTVTDGNGCTRSDTADIIEPTPLQVIVTKTDITCFGANDGGACVDTIIGGTAPYSGLTWDPPAGMTVGDCVINLPAGQICATYTDANGCADSACVTIIEPADITLVTSSTPVSCNGGNDGRVCVTATGGTGNFTYGWSAAGTDSANCRIGLSPGQVIVTVTDSSGCSKTDTTTITEPAAMVLTINKQDLTCNRSNDGLIGVTVAGGTGPYIYIWSAGTPTTNGDSTLNLPAGVVTLTVRDAIGCTITDTVTINEPAEIVIAQTFTSVVCPGGSNGSIDITVTGGSGVYTYRWSTGDTTQDLTGVTEGFYSVIVTDSSGCTATESFTLQLGTRFEVTANVINASCGNTDGIIDLTPSGGIGPYTYAWTGGLPATQDQPAVAANVYTVTVTDQGTGCTQTLDITVESVGGPTVNGNVVNATTCAASDGSITTSVTPPGSGAYSYVWTHPPNPTTPNLTNLTPGDYTVVVTDDTTGCVSIRTFTVGVQNQITLTGVAVNATCGGSDGGINLTVTPPGAYTYAWSNGSTAQNLANVGAGTYAVTVTGAGACTTTDIFTVSENGGPAVTATVTNVSCFGGQNGAITLNVLGANIYNWSNGATTRDITALKPGIYAVTVSDTASNCASLADFEVTEPDALTLVADRSNISCNGADDGWIDLITSGGNTPYTYNWSGPITATTEDIDSLAAGTYTVTVTDSNTCVSTLSITLTEPAPIVLVLDTQSVSCGGDSDGVAWIDTITGGVAPFTYAWSRGTGITNDTVTGLTTGMVRVTVTDANGCTATDSILVPQPAPLTLSITKTDITCFGANDGTATANPGGGTPGYTYLWNRGTDTTNTTVTGLAPGFVTVTVTDTNGCTISDSINIIEPDSLTLTVTGTNVTCFGDSNGTSQVVVTGGRTPYTYAWSDGDAPLNLSSVSGLFAGTVRVTVTDSSGCAKIDSITITAPATPVSTTITTTNVNCFGDSTGTATVVATGGTPGVGVPYTYLWTRGTPNTAATVTGLWVGDAVVTVTDSMGCSVLDTATITQPTQITVTTSQLDISCFGADDGRAYVDTVIGGTPATTGAAYTYLWTAGTGPLDRDSTIGLSAGPVTVTVTDSLGCEATATVTIIEPDSIGLTITKVDISCNGLTDGTATVVATGGTGSFTYIWSNFDTTSTADSLAAGVATVTVTDARNCSDSISITIIEPDSLLLTMTSTNVLCFGETNGTASVSATGGTPFPGNTYNYQWNVPGTTNAVSQLSAGDAIVTVTDARGCTATDTATITQPLTAVEITNFTKLDITCFGAGDGKAFVTGAGGTPFTNLTNPPRGPYNYAWSTGGPPRDLDSVLNLSAGIVSVTITDSTGCSDSDSLTILEPAELALTIAVDSNASCFAGAADGGLTVSLTGGTPNYVYHWSNGSPQPATPALTNSVAGLSVGAYTVTVTDASGCRDTISEDIVERAGPQIAANGVVLDRPTCDRADGGICITATTTDNPLSYQWSPSAVGNCPTGLFEGTYLVTITDGASCDTILSIDLLEIPGPNIDSFIIIKNSYCDDNDGRATAIVTSGVHPYVFTWIDLDSNNAVISNDSVVMGLEPGAYAYLVTDANGCSDSVGTFPITNIASPNVAILPGSSPKVIFQGQEVELFATSDIPTSQFTWKPSAGLSCSDCDTLIASPEETTTYVLLAVDTTTDCADSTYMTIIVKDETNVFIPNVITPNGDGVNDDWNLGELQEVFLNNEVVIVNRWGDEVYRAKNYGVTGSDNKFDGKYNGTKLPDGTYYYIIKLNDIGESVTGPLTIISE